MAAAYVLVERQIQRALRRERIFRDRNNPLDSLDDKELVSKYRLPRNVIIDLINVLHADLAHDTKRSNALSVHTQLLVSLRYYASGCFYLDTGDSHGVSKSSVSHSLHRVTEALCNRVGNYISFPMDEGSLRLLKSSFYEIANFPNVIGLVDGTAVPIKGPSIDDHLYICRKGFHALNVQIVCNASLKIMDIVSKWPGSSHDAYIWNNSGLHHKLQTEEINGGYILGDSGYPLRSYLLTPILNPTTRPQERYNTSHKRTRCTVERCIGVLKSRFRCLHKSGGAMEFSPEFCAKIVVATAILHNICVHNAVPEPEDVPNPTEQDDVEDEQEESQGAADGRYVRNALIAQRFT